MLQLLETVQLLLFFVRYLPLSKTETAAIHPISTNPCCVQPLGRRQITNKFVLERLLHRHALCRVHDENLLQ